jgi:heme exporter protein B
MALIAPVMGAMLHLPDGALPAMIVGLAIGTPALSLIGAIGAAITVGVRRGGLLLSILVLPLYIPTLILGARAVEQALLALSPWPTLGLLAALTLFSAALAPFAAAAALRINIR